MPTGVEIRGHGKIDVWRCGTERRALFEDVVNHTRGAIALSTAEAELYAMVDGVLKMKGMKSMSVELGLASSDDVIELQVDSAAGKSFISRRGLGKMRHVELRDLWIQREVGEGKFRVVKFEGTANPADVGTKFLSATELTEKLAVLYIELQFGRCVHQQPDCWRLFGPRGGVGL